MLIKKGEIYRNIDDKRLSEYKEKGYERVEDVKTAASAKTSKEKAQIATKGESND